jgi:hypothetical protein
VVVPKRRLAQGKLAGAQNQGATLKIGDPKGSEGTELQAQVQLVLQAAKGSLDRPVQTAAVRQAKPVRRADRVGWAPAVFCHQAPRTGQEGWPVAVAPGLPVVQTGPAELACHQAVQGVWPGDDRVAAVEVVAEWGLEISAAPDNQTAVTARFVAQAAQAGRADRAEPASAVKRAVEIQEQVPDDKAAVMRIRAHPKGQSKLSLRPW